VVFNYTAGEDVLLPLDPAQRVPAYNLRKPGLQQLRNDIQQGTTTLVVPDVDQLGNYRVLGIETDAKFERGFSVNLDVAASNLARIDEQQLAEILGETQFRLARNREEIDRNVSAGRVGRELFPLLMVAVAVVLGLEHLLSNLFYREGIRR